MSRKKFKDFYGIVYLTTNLINGKIYIGQTIYDNCKYLGSGKILKQAIKKYGKINFKKKILCICKNKKELDFAEPYLIKKFQARKFGYNITRGVFGGDNFAFNPDKEKIRKLNSENHKKEKNYLYRKDINNNIIRIINLVNDGKSYKEIGKIFNCSSSCICSRVNENKRFLFSEKNKIYIKKNSDIILNLRKNGMSLKKLAKYFDTTQKIINFILKENLTEDEYNILKNIAYLNRKPWNIGLTKETDIRIKICSEEHSKKMKGNIPWNKGLKIKEFN